VFFIDKTKQWLHKATCKQSQETIE